MLKATLRSAVLLGLLAWSAPSFAEVQNVKVSGEVNVRAFNRSSLRLSEDVPNNGATQPTSATAGQIDTGDPAATGAGSTDFGSADDSFIQQLTALNVDADLTENVSTQIRVINERTWGALDDGAEDQSLALANPIGDGSGSNDVEVSLANITLRELFYSPLTVKIGRQPLWFGRGLIVGSRIHSGDVDPGHNLAADEFSDKAGGFDAIRGTLDLSSLTGGMPVTMDAVYAKVEENDVSVTSSGDSAADDTNLAGINIGTKFDSMNGEVEAYFWDKRDNSAKQAGAGNIRGKPKADTLGFRGSVSPAEGLSIWSELAYQWGHRIVSGISYDAEGNAGDDYQAWAANFGADYTLADVAWRPTLGGEWIFFSGDNGTVCAPTTADPGCTGSTPSGIGSAIAGWEPMYHGYFANRLRATQTSGFYMPAQSGAAVGGSFAPITNSYTNQHELALHGTVLPIEDLVVDNRLSWFVADKGIRPTASAKRESFFGTEWDMNALYNYTDDVQIGAAWSIFWPGNVFRSPYDEISTQLVSSVSVKF